MHFNFAFSNCIGIKIIFPIKSNTKYIYFDVFFQVLCSPISLLFARKFSRKHEVNINITSWRKLFKFPQIASSSKNVNPFFFKMFSSFICQSICHLPKMHLISVKKKIRFSSNYHFPMMFPFIRQPFYEKSNGHQVHHVQCSMFIVLFFIANKFVVDCLLWVLEIVNAKHHIVT